MRQFLLGLIVGGGVATTAMMWLYADQPGRSARPRAVVTAPADTAQPDTAPADPRPTARPAPKPARTADTNGASAARIRAAAHERTIADLRQQLVAQTATLEHYIGKAIPFPADLDPMYREEALMQRFTDAIKAIGAEGEVTEVDCTEFPCVVYGKLQGDDGTAVRKMRGSDALSAYGDALDNMSVWAGQAVVDGQPTKNAAFGIAVMPPGGADVEAVGKRLRFRHQVYWSAIRSELHDND